MADPDPNPDPNQSPDPNSTRSAQRPPAASTPNPAAIDIQARIVNGILVVGVVAIVGMLYTYKADDSAMFGTFTTLVGTALSAYFGISATREVSRNAVDSSTQQMADANQQLGQLQQRHDVVTDKLARAKALFGPDSGTPGNDPAMDQLRSILA